MFISKKKYQKEKELYERAISNLTERLAQMSEVLISTQVEKANSELIAWFDLTRATLLDRRPEWAGAATAIRRKGCLHLKGGRKFRPAGHRDYNFSLHYFITGERRIKCLNNCGFEVWDYPENEPLWAKAIFLMRLSSNSSTSSEVVAPGFISGNTTGRPIDRMKPSVSKSMTPEEYQAEVQKQIEEDEKRDLSNPIRGMR